VWRSDASYLVTGGLGGLGLKIARWMAAAGAGSIVLLGRRGLPPRDRWDSLEPGSREVEQVAAIREIEALGTEVVVVSADVADPRAMADLFDRFGADLPELRGIVHAAATLGDAAVADLSREQVEAMLRPKVAGTWVLHRLGRDLPLDFFVLFSSTTALWGSRGLAHYAAANHFLDAFAHHRRAQGLPVLSVDWGTWDEMRVASTEEREVVASSGLDPMPSDRALELLADMLGRPDAVQVVVAAVDWTVLKAIYEARRERPFLSLVSSREPARARQAATATPVLAERLSTTEPGQRRDVVVDFLRDEVALALGIQAPLTIDVEQGLFEMGMDSLMSVELKGRIESAVGMNLPSTLTFNYPNISALTEFLLTDALTFADEDGDGAEPAAIVTADDAELPTGPADELDEDDLEALLAARLAKLKSAGGGP
jgi:NAD(P)-dependent dehydrogenase (short-subunit alcohol dehydrogenase family)/acyl carrier protein